MIASSPYPRLRLLIAVLVTLPVLLTAAPTPSHAQNWEDAIATLEVVKGTATVTFSGADTAATATRDFVPGDFAPIAAGDQIEVSDPGEALLTFFEGELTRLTAGTVLEVQQFDTSGDSVRIRFSVLAGQTLSAVSSVLDAESRYEVNTPAANISVRGTEFVVFVRPDQLTQVAATEGTVSVSALGESTDVPCGFGLKVAPGETLGELKVWGNAHMELDAPVEDISDIPITLINRDNDHVYHYHAGDPMMTVALGTYDLYLDIPGPVRLTDIAFPEDTLPLTVKDIPIALGAVVFEAVDASGSPIDELIVTLTQDDLSGTTTAAPGEPLLVGPGAWTATLAPASDPAQTQTLDMTAVGGDIATVPVEFGATSS